MISSLHGLYDDRIYWKEAVSLKKHGYDVIHVSTGDEDSDQVSKEGIRLIQVRKIRYFRNPYLDIIFRKLTARPGIYGKMFRICAATHADVYHFHDIQINRIAGKLKRLPHAPKIIYDVHEDFADLLVSQYPKPGLMRMLARCYGAWLNHWELSKASTCDYIIGAVEHICKKFKPIARWNRIAVICNYTTLQPANLKPYELKKYDAIYCGQINPFRGAMQIAGAVALVKQQMPGIQVLLLGPVPDVRFREKLSRFIAGNELQKNVILHEPVPYGEIDGFYQDSRIGLGIFLPASIFYYGIQIKTFEYMAYGLPLVCSNFGNIDRIVRDTGTGITVDPLSPAEIGDALVRLLNDHALYLEYSMNGMQAVAKSYNWKTEERKLLGIYRGLTHARAQSDLNS